MAKCYITHACGHEQKHELLGPSSKRKWRMEKLEEQICNDCYYAKRDEERKKEYEFAIRFAADKGLPNLTGTEKQIKFAESLRAQVLKSEKFSWLISNVPEISLELEKIMTTISSVYWIESSREWLDETYNKYFDLMKLLEKIESVLPGMSRKFRELYFSDDMLWEQFYKGYRFNLSKFSFGDIEVGDYVLFYSYGTWHAGQQAKPIKK